MHYLLIALSYVVVAAGGGYVGFAYGKKVYDVAESLKKAV